MHKQLIQFIMSNPYFRFKQFTVWHDKCAMKVGTDGVLLGAWVNIVGCNSLLDVGTGTGLIALILAQRSQASLIDAIDIDASACLQAQENVSQSPFANRIQITHTSYADFASTCSHRYDLIISNPPYFVDSLKCPDPQRRTARHSDTLPLDSLLCDSKKIVSPHGRLALVLPYDRKTELQACCERRAWYLSKETTVVPVANLQPKRLLVELTTTQPHSLIRNELVIETTEHRYTEDYINLTKAFYLKM